MMFGRKVKPKFSPSAIGSSDSQPAAMLPAATLPPAAPPACSDACDRSGSVAPSVPGRPGGATGIIDAWLARAAEEGTSDHYVGKRRTSRYQWVVPVLLEVRSVNKPPRVYHTQCRDIGPRGISVRCPEAIADRTPVHVFVDDGEDCVLGVVRHCSTTVGAYILGIEFVGDPPA